MSYGYVVPLGNKSYVTGVLNRRRYVEESDPTVDFAGDVLLSFAGQSNSTGWVVPLATDTPNVLLPLNGSTTGEGVFSTWTENGWLNGEDLGDRNRDGDGSGKMWDQTGNTWQRWGAFDLTKHYLAPHIGGDQRHVTLSQGGTELGLAGGGATWNPDVTGRPALQQLMSQFEARFDAAVAADADAQPAALFWHQGEQDSQEAADIAAYQDNWEAVVARFREIHDNPNLPIIHGTVPAASLQYNADIRAAQLAVAASDANIYCRDCDDLPLAGDDIHFNQVAETRFGRWAAETFLNHYNIDFFPAKTDSASLVVQSQRAAPYFGQVADDSETLYQLQHDGEPWLATNAYIAPLPDGRMLAINTGPTAGHSGLVTFNPADAVSGSPNTIPVTEWNVSDGFGTAYVAGNKLVLLPQSGTDVGFATLDDPTRAVRTVASGVARNGGLSTLRGYVHTNGKVYSCPAGFQRILEIDPVLETVTAVGPNFNGSDFPTNPTKFLGATQIPGEDTLVFFNWSYGIGPKLLSFHPTTGVFADISASFSTTFTSPLSGIGKLPDGRVMMRERDNLNTIVHYLDLRDFTVPVVSISVNGAGDMTGTMIIPDLAGRMWYGQAQSDARQIFYPEIASTGADSFETLTDNPAGINTRTFWSCMGADGRVYEGIASATGGESWLRIRGGSPEPLGSNAYYDLANYVNW